MVATAVPYRPLLQINFGSPARATDETLGKVTQAYVHAGNWHISHVVVERGLLAKKRLFLPVDLITEARVNGVQFSLTVDELLAKSQAPKGSELVAMREHLPIFSGKDKIGTLSQLFFDATTGQLSHLVVHRHAIAGGEVLLGSDQLERLTADRLEINVSSKEFAILPHYRADPELAEAVRQALWNYPRLRVDLGAVQVYAQCNDVWLQGYVSSEMNRRLADNQARLVPEVRSLYNELIADNDLAMEIAAALAKSEITRGLPIGVYPNLGEVYLRGVVPTAEAREAAEAIASEAPDVKAVHNELAVSPKAEFLPAMAGVTGGEDIVPGKEETSGEA
jgi:osmotically-inducible protein OsmY